MVGAALLVVACGAGPRAPDPEPVAVAPTPTPAPEARRDTAARPVLLVTLDTVRADRIGAYGQPRPLTPHLDRLSRSGVLFARALAQAAVTPVSHASIFTGQYPYHHGLRVLHGAARFALPDGAVTLAERLRGAGFETGAFISAFPAGSRFGLGQGFTTFDDDFGGGADDRVTAGGIVTVGTAQRTGDETTARALRWLAAEDGAPFLWVHYFDAHDSGVVAPTPFVELLDADGSAAERRRHTYEAELAFDDAQLGRLLLGTRARLGDRAIVVVVADHGEGLGDHGWWTHGILYQEQLRVPLIVAARDLPRATVVPYLVRTIDIAPTVLDLAGLPEAEGCDGISLVAVARGAPDPGLDSYADSLGLVTYAQAAMDGGTGFEDVREDMLLSLTRGEVELIRHQIRPGESELYDLDSDPRELHNRFSIDKETATDLSVDLLGRAPMPRPAAPEGTAEDLDKLRALGYVTN